MSFRVNFFPIPYILVLILIIAFVAVFNETIYSYFAANFEINGAIVGLFIFCNIWILGTLAYYSRNARLLSGIFSAVGPVVKKQSLKKPQDENSSMVLQPSYTIAGTLFDSPVFSGVLAKFDRKNKLEVSKSDADEIAQCILDNALRVLSPSKFIASIFVLCGLIGTFFGLLETIGGVARALNTLSSSGLTSDVSKFIKLLSDPLQGMSTAFSASLFGLTSALVSNFGNHVAWQKVLLFATKVRNYLLSNAGVFDEDPARITVRDLLVSLEESFDMLYRGITNKLEDLTNHIATMGSVIVKTHERQEKMLRVILKDHELMEQFWRKFLLSDEGVMGIIDGIAERVSVILPESFRKVFAPVLENMLDIMDNNSAMLERALDIAQHGVGVQTEIADISSEVTKILDESVSILNRVSDELIGIHSKLNLDHVASLIAEGNGIKRDIASFTGNSADLLNEANALSKSSNEISIETNRLADNLISSVGSNTAAVEEVISSLGYTNAIMLDVKAIGQQSKTLIEDSLYKQDISNDLGKRILDTSYQSNSIGSDTLVLLGNILTENNELSRTLLSVVSDIAQHNENIIRILDERFGMIIAFTSDLLSSSSNILSAIVDLRENLVRSYEDQYFRLDNINSSIGNVATLIDAGVTCSNAIIQRLDNSNELTVQGLQSSSDILANMFVTNDVLSNVYSAATQYFNDSANFSNLYVGIERQVSVLLNSFLEFKQHFNDFLNNASINAQTLNSISSLSSNISERIGVVGSMLNDIAVSLSNLNGITGDHKNLSISIREAIENMLGQSNDLNRNVVSLSGVFDSGINKVVEGISAISNSSSSYAQTMNELLESIVSNLSILSDISAKSSSLIDIDKQTSSTVSEILSQLNIATNEQKYHATVTEEVKNILTNTDSNIMGIGNLLSNIKSSGEKLDDKLNSIITFNKSLLDYNSSATKSNDRVEKSLEQIAMLVSNLGVVYEKHSENVKDNLEEIIKGVTSIFHINSEISKLINSINSLSSSIEKDVYGKANNEILNDVREKLVEVVFLKQNILTDFKNSLLPALQGFDDGFATVSNRLAELSSVAETNKDLLSNINSDTSGKLFSQLSAVNSSILNVNKNFSDLSNQLVVISKLFDAQKDTFSNIYDGIKDIKSLAKSIGSIPKVLSDSSAAINAINNTMSLLYQNSGKVNESLIKFSNYLSEELKSLAAIVGQLDGTFKSELVKVTHGNNEVYNSISKLVNEISVLGNELRNSNSLDKLANENLIKELNGSFAGISGSISDIKSAISSVVSNQLVTELNKISVNQQEMSYKLDHISPYISDLVRVVENLSSNSTSSELVKVVSTLEKINNSDISSNAKLDVLIKAADTLVTEMLNSRNVSQAILDIIAELGGFKRVK